MKNYIRCYVREPARCATNSCWLSRIFYPSRSLGAPGVSLASWWHGPWISEDGRTLTSLFGGLGIALKSVHGTGFGRSAFRCGHHVSQRDLATPWPVPPAERLAELSHRRRATVPARLVVLLPCLALLPLGPALWPSDALRA